MMEVMGLPLTHDSELRPTQVWLPLLLCEVLAVAHVDAVVLVADPEDGEVDVIICILDAEAIGALIQRVELLSIHRRFVPLHGVGLTGVADEVDGCVLLGSHVAWLLPQPEATAAYGRHGWARQASRL